MGGAESKDDNTTTNNNTNESSNTTTINKDGKAITSVETKEDGPTTETKESDDDEASEIDDAEVEGDKGPAFGWGTAAKRKGINVNDIPTDPLSILQLATSSIPVHLLEIACRNFEIEDFDPHKDIIDILVNKHPSKNPTLELYTHIKKYRKQLQAEREFAEQQQRGLKKDLAKTLLTALKHQEILNQDRVDRPVINAMHSKNAFHLVIHYILYLIHNIPKGLDVKGDMLNMETDTFENIIYPEYTIQEAEEHVKIFAITFSLIRAKAKEGNLQPEYQGAFSGNKSPEEIIKMYETEPGIHPSQDVMNSRIAKTAAETMRNKLGITHFDVEYGDTASVLHHLGKRSIYDIIRGSEKDIMKRTPYAYMCGLLLLQNYHIKDMIRIMCYSIGSYNPEVEIHWEKLIVHFIASSLFAHCISLGEIADSVGYAGDYPQLPQEAYNLALKEAIVSKDEVLIFTSSESDEEDDEDTYLNPRSRGLTQGMNQSQIYMNMKKDRGTSEDDDSNDGSNTSSRSPSRNRASSIDSNISEFSEDENVDTENDSGAEAGVSENEGEEDNNNDDEEVNAVINKFKIKKDASKWLTVKRRMAEKRAGDNLKDYSKMTESEKKTQGLFMAAMSYVSKVKKKRRKVKTEFRWKTLRTKWLLGLKEEKQKSDKLIESFTTVVDRAVRQEHVQQELRRRQTHPLYIRMKNKQRYLPLNHAMDGVDHIEPLCRAIALISLWLYDEGFGGPKAQKSSFSNLNRHTPKKQKNNKKVTLKLLLHLMNHKNVPSANLTTKTHSFAVHVANFGQDTRNHAYLTMAKSMPLNITRRETIWTAAKNNNIEVIEGILRSGVDIGTRDSGAGRTCLHIAASYGHRSLVFWLLINGADPWGNSKLGMNALHYACKHGHHTVVSLLLDWEIDVSNRRGAKHMKDEYINHKNPLSKATAMHYAVHGNSYESAKQLLLRFADTAIFDNDRRTCLDLAVGYNHEKIIKLIQNDKKKYANQAVTKYYEAKQLGILLLKPPLGIVPAYRRRYKLKKSKVDTKQFGALTSLNIMEPSETKHSNVVKYLFEHVQKYTIYQYKKSKKYQSDDFASDPPLFSVLTYKALAYTACHMALLRSILSYDKSIANNIYQHKRDPNDDKEEDIWGTED